MVTTLAKCDKNSSLHLKSKLRLGSLAVSKS